VRSRCELPPLSQPLTGGCAAEIMDHGFPQILSAESLKLYITQEGVHSEMDASDVRVRHPCHLATSSPRSSHLTASPLSASGARWSRAIRRCRSRVQSAGAVMV
jgi:hypothetical protein